MFAFSVQNKIPVHIFKAASSGDADFDVLLRRKDIRSQTLLFLCRYAPCPSQRRYIEPQDHPGGQGQYLHRYKVASRTHRGPASEWSIRRHALLGSIASSILFHEPTGLEAPSVRSPNGGIRVHDCHRHLHDHAFLEQITVVEQRVFAHESCLGAKSVYP